jgi:hypothetical protein
VAAVDEILAELSIESGRIAGFVPPDSVSLINDAIERAASADEFSSGGH